MQNRARDRYCAAYPTDEVCTPFTGGQSNVFYWVKGKATVEYCQYYEFREIKYECRLVNLTYNSQVNNIKVPGKILGILSRYGVGFEYGGSSGPYGLGVQYDNGSGQEQAVGIPPNHISESLNWYVQSRNKVISASITSVTRVDGQPDTDGNPPPLPWKDWSQAKRDAAVALLTDSDWQRLITSMPKGGTLDPGDTVKAPKIVIPGQEWDNPNTLGDDRRLKTVPGEHARPVVPDFDHDSDPDETDADDDNDGVIEPYDPEPRNPYIPSASSEPPSPPEDERTEQSEGERAVSKVRQSYGDFLEKAENDTFENRLDTIEAKYKRAAVEEDEIERDWLNMEANDELAQLKDELGEAWWASLSTHEQQLFDIENRSQADIDEIQMHMKQWDKSTFNDVAHSIVRHAPEKGYTDYLEYLRDASNFDKSRSERIPREGIGERGTVRWEIRNTGEYIIETPEGKIVTYGQN